MGARKPETKIEKLKLIEQFVPYEIAIKLKEKGFIEPCIGWWYNPTGNDPDLFLVEYGEAEDNNSVELDPEQEDMKDVANWKQICEEKKHSCSGPLWQEVVEWFKETHSINVGVYYHNDSPTCCAVVEKFSNIGLELFVKKDGEEIEFPCVDKKFAKSELKKAIKAAIKLI